MIAVRRPDGNWIRLPRDEALHGPAPYSQQWYLQYLRRSNLPPFFLRPGHPDMRLNATEADWLGINFPEPTSSFTPGMLAPHSLLHAPSLTCSAENYLEFRYPETPQVPKVVKPAKGMSYHYILSPLDCLRLARNFPATNLLVPGEVITIRPDGYIYISHDPAQEQLEILNEDQVEWKEDKTTRHASYSIALAMPTAARTAAQRAATSASDRDRLQQRERAAGNLVNPSSVPAGQGRFVWLQDSVDQPRAAALGFHTPQAVAEARQRGALATGTGVNVGPVAVFRPYQAYLNPTQQPSVTGHWDYITPESRELAQLNFANQEGFGLGDVGDVTPEHIWQLRLRSRQRMQEDAELDDPTASVDLVWVPDQAPDGDEEVKSEKVCDSAAPFVCVDMTES